MTITGAKDERLYVFLDEIQNMPEITKVIKYLIDHYKTKFVVTGSSSFYLKNLFPESLSGRKFLFVLPTLSFKEYLYFTDAVGLDEAGDNDLEGLLSKTDLFLHKRYEVAYEQYLRYGGFPEVVTTEDMKTKSMVLHNIFGSFFEKDIHLLSDHSDIRQLRDLILLLVPRVGSMIDITKLADDLSIKRPKLYSFLDFLQNTFMIRLLPKFSHSIDRSIAGGKKVYFTDTGLLLAIGNVNDGQLFENAICNQLSHYGTLSFYNKRNTAEVDFILNKEIAFEAKLTGDSRDVQKLQKLATGLRLHKYYVLSKTYSDKKGVVSTVNI
jgi:predicted AAA+ superfamily ATPase